MEYLSCSDVSWDFVLPFTMSFHQSDFTVWWLVAVPTNCILAISVCCNKFLNGVISFAFLFSDVTVSGIFCMLGLATFLKYLSNKM